MEKRVMDERLLVTHFELMLSELQNNYMMSPDAKVIIETMKLLSRMARRDQASEAYRTLNTMYFDGLETGATNRILTLGERRSQ
jgi:hypothetical protein